jgi:hypothetical protein
MSVWFSENWPPCRSYFDSQLTNISVAESVYKFRQFPSLTLSFSFWIPLRIHHSLSPQPTIMTEPEQPKPSLPVFDPNNCQSYAASCHCGIVQYDVLLSPPLPQWKVVSCNCSICSRNGYLLVYPERSQLHMKSGEEALKTYSFGVKRNLHKLCGQCGSSVFFDPRMKEFGEAPPDLLGVNVSSICYLSSS